MEIVREVRSWGNSAGILLPKEWKGKEAKIILIDRSLEIKKEVFDILDDYLEDIFGIYLTGSYARGEQTKESDIDIIAISETTSKEIISGKYNISIVPLDSIKRSIKNHPILIYPRLIEAKVLLNKSLLKKLLSARLTSKSFNLFIEDCKRIIKINKEFIELDKLEGEYLDSSAVVYSLVLRLRGVFLMKKILKQKEYSKKQFKGWLKKELKEDIENVYSLYEAIRDNNKIREKIKISTVEKLLNLLEKEVIKYGK